MQQLLKFNFGETLIEFEIQGGSVMVNATKMANAFDKKVEAFMRNDNTKAFLSACLKSENSRFLDIKKDEDLIQSRQKSGTWMHRVLALKFAAWLDPDFEVWVYTTIDKILFDHYRKMEESLRRSAQRHRRIEELKEQLGEVAEFSELQRLELEERQEVNRRSKENRLQLDMFKETIPQS